MLQLNTLKHRNIHLILFMQFLLLLGTAQSSWCIHDGQVNVVPDTLLKNYLSVPFTCLTSSSMLVEQNDRESPYDCSGCIDLTFEEVTPTILSPETLTVEFVQKNDQLQTTLLVSLSFPKTRLLNLPVKYLFSQELNLHKTIQSTVIII